jgi:hypothetical protein
MLTIFVGLIFVAFCLACLHVYGLHLGRQYLKLIPYLLIGLAAIFGIYFTPEADVLKICSFVTVVVAALHGIDWILSRIRYDRKKML